MRDTAVSEIFAPTIRRALAKAGTRRGRHPACGGPRADPGPLARHWPGYRDRCAEPRLRRRDRVRRPRRGARPVRACARGGAGEARRAHPACRFRQRLRRAGPGNDGADAGRGIGGRGPPAGAGLRRLSAFPEPERGARPRLGRALGIRAEGPGDRHRALRARHDRIRRRKRRGRECAVSRRVAFP